MPTPAIETPEVTMQALALGLPRCGTTSMTAILQSDILGITPVFHTGQTTSEPGKQDLVLHALSLKGKQNSASRRAKLRQLIDGHAACTETLNVLADDLMDMYPDAKLILNVRCPSHNNESPAASWTRSCNEATGFFGSNWALAVCWPVNSFRFWWYRYRLQTDIWREKGILNTDIGHALAPKGCQWMREDVYEGYLHWVKREAGKRARPILIWHPEMGWEPLCNLFGRTLPRKNTPLPRLNCNKASRSTQCDYLLKGLFRYALLIALVGVLSVLGW